MTDFRSRLAQVMAEKNMRAAELSRRTGISKPRLSQYLSGVYIPKADAICLIAQALEINEGYLLGTSDTSVPDKPVVAKFKALPVVGEIACGAPVFVNEEDDGLVITDIDTDADFCLIAKGDSMKDARICNGDTVFIKKTDVVSNGEIAAVVINDEATLKRVYFYPDEAKLVLSPENPRYAPLVYLNHELDGIKIIGKAVAFQSAVI